ncbi:hypothetical protein QQX98_009724 [Neonectria punicea]|uniref:Heterokaryon incompatibility domain-containing protein n=1 Tax=Neonectria punicea TaxID=979145 RepID=A0ABR1GRM9_9HYPO
MKKLASNFTYGPIDYATDIRLLELQPGTPTQEIRCSLKRVNLAQAGDFEALSYTWGDVTIFAPSHAIPANSA